MITNLDRQTRIVQIIQSISGALSVIGSTIIINMILRSKIKLKSTYRRYIFGMSVFDLFSSITQTLSLVPITSIQACNVQALFTHLGFLVTPMYNGSLCIYYVLTVCFDKKDPWIRKKVEPFCHFISIFWNVGTGIFLWLDKSFNRAGANCWIAPYPRDCILEPDIACERGPTAYKYRWWFIGYQSMCIFLIITVSMIMLVIKVHRQERRMRNRFSVFNPLRNSTNPDNNEHQPGTINRNQHLSGPKKQMVKQATVYFLAYFIPFIFPTIFMIQLNKTGKRNFTSWILMALFSPLQGFFNCIVFIRPRIASMKNSSPNLSWAQAFFATITVRPKLSTDDGRSRSGIELESERSRSEDI